MTAARRVSLRGRQCSPQRISITPERKAWTHLSVRALFASLDWHSLAGHAEREVLTTSKRGRLMARVTVPGEKTEREVS
jgi:hypothetical protein